MTTYVIDKNDLIRPSIGLIDDAWTFRDTVVANMDRLLLLGFKRWFNSGRPETFHLFLTCTAYTKTSEIELTDCNVERKCRGFSDFQKALEESAECRALDWEEGVYGSTILDVDAFGVGLISV